jgi:tetratricopeptide (TPR) repeat protein
VLQGSAWIGWLVFLGLIGAFCFARPAAVRMGIAAFSLPVIPVLFTFLKNNPVNEHWAYLPSVGFAVVLGAFCARLNRWKIRTFGMGHTMGILFLAAYVLLCWVRNPHFRDNYALYTDGIKKRPDMTLYYINLGEVYEKRGESEKAKALWEKALDLDPGVESAYRNIGVLYAKQGDNAKAVEYFEKELSLFPDKTSTMMDLGRAYLQMNRPWSALPYYERALAIDPRFTPVELNKIAVDFYLRREVRFAARLWEMIIESSPDFPEAYISLGTTHAKAGRHEQAVSVWEQYLQRFPAHARAGEVTAWMEDVKRKAKATP